jgi:hypothetical protein
MVALLFVNGAMLLQMSLEDIQFPLPPASDGNQFSVKL